MNVLKSKEEKSYHQLKLVLLKLVSDNILLTSINGESLFTTL